MRWLPVLAVFITLVVITMQPAYAQEPELTVTSPEEGAMVPGSTMTVTFEVDEFEIVPSTIPVEEAGQHPEVNREGEGHLHLMLDQQPLVVWDRDEPYTFTDIPAGTHQLMVELANNDHSPLSPPVVQTIQFTSGAAPQALPTTGRSALPLPLALMLILVLILVGVFLLTGSRVVRRFHASG